MMPVYYFFVILSNNLCCIKPLLLNSGLNLMNFRLKRHISCLIDDTISCHLKQKLLLNVNKCIRVFFIFLLIYKQVMIDHF